MNPPLEYSPEEIEILRDIYASHETIRSQLHRLPNRSRHAIPVKARALGLVKAGNAMARINQLMADGKPRSVRQIEAATGLRRKYIVDQLRIRANGIDYHIHSYTGVQRGYVFKAGPGTNAVRPPAANIPAKVYSARWRERHSDDRPVKAKTKAARKTKAKPARGEYDPALERLKDEKYRLPAQRRQQSDSLVFDAISAMARVGRRAA